MDADLQSYSHLAGIEQAPRQPNGALALSFASAAAGEAIRFVDQQVGVIEQMQIPGGFPGAEEMMQAAADMQAAAAGWQEVRADIEASAQHAIGAGPAAAALGGGDRTAAQIVAQVNLFRTTVLSDLIARFAEAEARFDDFNEAMEAAYGNSANANQAAAYAMDIERGKIDSEIQDLQEQEDNLSSAGSILTGIISLGISYAVKMRELEEQKASLSNDEQRMAWQEKWYETALGHFKNGLNAVQLASYALTTLSTSLQQSSNALKDISTATSANPAVMNALLLTFKNEFSQAVANVERLIA
jgi:hypothetical protein